VTTCIKNVKFKIKIRIGCQYVGYFYYSENLNWAAQNLRLGRGSDIAALGFDRTLIMNHCYILHTFCSHCYCPMLSDNTAKRLLINRLKIAVK